MRVSNQSDLILFATVDISPAHIVRLLGNVPQSDPIDSAAHTVLSLPSEAEHAFINMSKHQWICLLFLLRLTETKC